MNEVKDLSLTAGLADQPVVEKLADHAQHDQFQNRQPENELFLVLFIAEFFRQDF
mgnify:CR=1 FL=1